MLGVGVDVLVAVGVKVGVEVGVWDGVSVGDGKYWAYSDFMSGWKKINAPANKSPHPIATIPSNAQIMGLLPLDSSSSKGLMTDGCSSMKTFLYDREVIILMIIVYL